MPSLSGRGLFVPDPATLLVVEGQPIVSLDDGVPVVPAEVWASMDNGVPVLVWVKDPTGPTGASRTYQAADQSVKVDWTVPAAPTADAYVVTRPDGSVVGTVAAPALTLTDFVPRFLTGAYVVAGSLKGTLSSATAATSSLNLRAKPIMASTGWAGGDGTGDPVKYGVVPLTWSHPAGYGRPTSYQLYRDGVLVALLDGSQTAWTDPFAVMGKRNSYQLYPVLHGATDPTTFDNVNVDIPPATPRQSPSLQRSGSNFLTLIWHPADYGNVVGYQVQYTRNGSGFGSWPGPGLGGIFATVNRSGPGGPDMMLQWTDSTPSIQARVRTMGTANSPYGESAWITSNSNV